MKEGVKTAIFLVVAVVALAAAWASRPRVQEMKTDTLVGHPLFEGFTDPEVVPRIAGMQILQYDEQTATPHAFEVAQVKGRWSIPSHENYPTDAKDQLALAAGGLMNNKVLAVVGDDPGTHAEFGVVDPKNCSPGATGVGLRVSMKDRDGKQMLGMIIGKQVADRPGQHYVRRLGDNGEAQDQVYLVEAQTDKLSTKFEDWIEKNLLKMSSWDIKGIQIEDYSIIRLGDRAGFDPGKPRTRIDLACNEVDPRWVLEKMAVLNPKTRKWEPSKLAPDQELDTAKLDALKTALDDLKIVDVLRKPQGLSGELRAKGEIVAHQVAVASLQECGFYLVPTESGDAFDIYSNKGEVRVGMKDGVQYVLRFGEIAGMGTEDKAKKDADAKKPGAKGAESTGPGVNRYLFVMAEFDQDAIPKPILKPLPESLGEKKPADKAKTDDTKKDAAKDGEAKKDDAPKDAAKKDDAKADEEKEEGDKKDEPKADPADEDETAKDSPKKDEPGKDAAKAAAKKVDKEFEEKALKALREQIKKDNQRAEEQYKETIEKGKAHAKELNARFADWYYVISDDVYRKIHLSRDQIVTKKGKAKPKAKMPGIGDGHEHDLDEEPPIDKGDKSDDKPAGPEGALEKLRQEGPGGEE
jgi:hypothetical protein